MNNNIRIKSIAVPDEVDEVKIVRILEVICIDKLMSTGMDGITSEDFYFLCFEKGAIEKKIYVLPVNGEGININKFSYEVNEQWGRHSSPRGKERGENKRDHSSGDSEAIRKE